MTANTLFLAQHPYISHIIYGKQDYVGIIQNTDAEVTSIYDFSVLATDDKKRSFLSLAEQWWWESARKVPINLFLRPDWDEFSSTLKTLNSKEVTFVFGPRCSIREIVQKRSKRRTIKLLGATNI